MVKNCWEVKGCGREPGGDMIDELGVCPAAVNAACDGINHGSHAGRICWAIAGTLCGGKVCGSSAAKRITCLACEFYSRVHKEEGKTFCIVPLEPGMAAADQDPSSRPTSR